MGNLSLYQELEKLLRMESRYCSEDGVLLKNSIVESALALRPDLIRMLLTHEGLKNNFFSEVDGLLVFDKVRFQKFVMNKRFLPDSYTSFKNKIGLTGDDGDFLAESREVVLSWPYKDCVLEGGQTKEDAKRNEVFWNEILAPDEINRLTEPKVLTGFARYDADGKHEISEVSEQDNLIIKGNNLLALHSLLKKYRGKVKLIYIDPPYNTGNDGFQYNDSFNHSSWLTFMRNRLTAASELLSNDGSIWINLDDNESHYLKIICDDIFGRDNFVANVIWEKSDSPRMDAHYFSVRHDNIIIFAKNKSTFKVNGFLDSETPEHYNKIDDNGKEYYTKPLMVMGGNESESLYFGLTAPDGVIVYPLKKDGTKGCWRWSQRKVNEESQRLEWVNGRNGWVPYFRIYAENRISTPPETLWTNKEAGSNRTSKNEIRNLFGENVFDTPKPEKLIEKIIHIGTDKGDLVLDYHLGSGTTAAVAHKMGRRYIGVEQMDYIETVAVERLRKVIGTKKEGTMFGDEHDCDQGGISKAVGWTGGGSFVYCELAKANQNFVDEISAATTKEQLTAIWERMQQSGFLSWKITPSAINNTARDFADLSVDDTRRFLIESLDKNLLYIPLSEIDNTEFAITDTDKQLNSQFYGK